MGRPATCDCGECPKCRRRIYMRQWYRDRPGYAAAKVRARRYGPDGDDLRAYERARYHDDLEAHRKTKARNAVNIRVARGTMTPAAACQRCGATGRTEAHHADYSRPLDVEWLCTTCHATHHYPD